MSKWRCLSRSEDCETLEGSWNRVGQQEVEREAEKDVGQAEAVRDMRAYHIGNNRIGWFFFGWGQC